MADIPSDISEDEDDVEDDSLSEGLEDDVSDTELENRKRQRAERLAYLQHKDKKRRMINEYNAFNFYSRPASIIVALGFCFEMQLHSVMRQLDQLHNDMIWLSIVGVTDQYLQNHISHSSYAVCYTEILSTVMSLNLQDEESVGCIRQSCEPRLLLYRFWSLYESMLNSEYLVSKLQLTQSKSRWAQCSESQRIDQIHVNELLTKAGISLHDSKQPFLTPS